MAAQDQAKPTLAAKLAEIMTEVERVAKRGRNDFHKYDYATESDITAAIREHLAARKLIILPRVTKWTTLDKAGEKGGVLAFVDMTFAIVDGETGETLECPWLGCGEDKGDKAVYKAFTGALKYFLLKLFLIPTGDDPERERKKVKREERSAQAPEPARDPNVEYLTPADVQRVVDVAKRAGYKSSADLHPFTRELFNVESLKLVPRSGLDRLLEAIAPDLKTVPA